LNYNKDSIFISLLAWQIERPLHGRWAKNWPAGTLFPSHANVAWRYPHGGKMVMK